jgi:hypothetical protein
MPNLRLFCGLRHHVPRFGVVVMRMTLTAIVWMPRIGFVILAVVPFTRHFAMLARRLARRMLTALFALR